MAKHARSIGRYLVLGWLLGTCFVPLLQMSAQAESRPLWREDAQRFRVGLRLFPACLGALESLETRLTPDGSLLVLVVYEGSAQTAEQAVASLRSLTSIRGFPLQARAIAAEAMGRYSGDAPSAVFVASLDLGSGRIRRWAERHRVLVFSPFAGDVEAGAVAGIYVTDQILPYVNVTVAERVGARFKSFFLEVARRYEAD